MKYFFMVILVIASISDIYSQFIEKDKAMHFSAGMVVSTLAYTMAYDVTKNKKKAFLISTGSTIVIGSLKEFADTQSNGKFDSKDLMATTLGGLVSNITLILTLDKTKREKRLKEEEKIKQIKLEEIANR
jgi:glucose uptake protein GlcU